MIQDVQMVLFVVMMDIAMLILVQLIVMIQDVHMEPIVVTMMENVII